ncbi:MAG: hypothetical protein RL653_2103 [Pseudomonadota bacterium]|jgi:hypothetical protein
MPRGTRTRGASVLEISPAPPEPAHAQAPDVDRLRDVLRARRTSPSPAARPSFRDRLQAWLEEEL